MSEPIMLPASFAQELLWLTDRASPGNISYNVPRTLSLRGALDVTALQRAFDALVERHEILRTTYATHDEQVVQVIHDPRPVPFDFIDLSAQPAVARLAEATRLVRERSARPFDLASDLLLRVTLIRMDATDHVLLFESHHVAFDGWSRDIVFRELDAFYAAFASGQQADLPELPIQYADYSIWQREELQGDRLAGLLNWWRNELGDAEHVLHLPTDFQRPNVSGVDGVFRSIHFSAETRNSVKAIGQRNNATTYMVLLAAYATVLHRYSGQPDVLVGSPSAGRARTETEGLIGYFANTIVQRARFADNPTFGALVSALRESALGAYDHQDVPFEKLVLEFDGRAATGHSPLFQVVFTQLDASDAPEGRLGSVKLEPFAVDLSTTKFDLTLFMAERPEGLSLTLRGRRDLHHGESLERFLEHMRAVLDTGAANPDMRVSDIPLLPHHERSQLAAWNDTAVNEGAFTSLIALFEAQAARVPDRIAVTDSTSASLTYAELNARANQLAHHLQSMDVRANAPVGLGVDRSVNAIVGLLGILKAGACYVPVALEQPESRRVQQLKESGAQILVTEGADSVDVPCNIRVVRLDASAVTLAEQADINPQVTLTPENLAYVLFTSGSTGTPKGVAVTHANVVHYARAVSRVLGDAPATIAGDAFAALDGLNFGMVSTLGADLGGTSLWTSLLSGGTLHVLGADTTTDPSRFADYVASHKLDVLKITPNHLIALSAGKTGPQLAAVLPARWIVLGGEALRPEVARTLLGANSCRVLNHYGPTESTVGVCTFEVTRDSLEQVLSFGAQTIPVGSPLANTRTYIVGGSARLQPIGIPGELWIGGTGVTVGYFNRDDLSAERFVQFDGDHGMERVYRTGDRVRRLPNGSIEFLGRIDDQVKVRGYRVELGEIEHVLRSHAGVESTVVIMRTNGEDSSLIAYAVAKRDGYAASHSDRATSESLSALLAAHLPDYMVPSAVVMLDALPLTANGKVDKAKLPAPDAEARGENAFVAPRTATEQKLATMWEEVLKQSPIGITDNFMSLGGHSLLAIRVLGKISKVFGIRLPLRTLFDAPTVEQLADLLDVEVQLAALDALSNNEQPAR
ncbi:MAG: amino acid adenylation domain-containing protein [Gemmatimonadaceae bacterium]